LNSAIPFQTSDCQRYRRCTRTSERRIDTLEHEKETDQTWFVRFLLLDAVARQVARQTMCATIRAAVDRSPACVTHQTPTKAKAAFRVHVVSTQGSSSSRIASRRLLHGSGSTLGYE